MRQAVYIAATFAALLWNCGSLGHGAPRLPPPDTSAELKLLQGKWWAVDCVWEGGRLMGRRLLREDLHLQVTGRRWVLSGGMEIELERHRYSIVLNRTATPWHIDLQWVDDSGKPVEMTHLYAPNGGDTYEIRKYTAPLSKGICECDGKLLTVSFGRPGETRAVTLDKSKLDEGQTLIVFERVAE
jgi:uncharacterized protein (TIGR03067 family)